MYSSTTAAGTECTWAHTHCCCCTVVVLTVPYAARSVTYLFLLRSCNKVRHVRALWGLGINGAPISSVVDASHMQLLPDDFPLDRQQVLAWPAPWDSVVGSFHDVLATSWLNTSLRYWQTVLPAAGQSC